VYSVGASPTSIIWSNRPIASSTRAVDFALAHAVISVLNVMTVGASPASTMRSSNHGGADSIIEPIAEHLPEYEYVLATYFGTGTQAAYRGKRLYDPASPASKALVIKWVSWFKQYRRILNADSIHVRRPDLAGIDAMLLVSPNTTRTTERGMLMVWNQTPQAQNTSLRVPPYYTGLETTALVSVEGAVPKSITLDRDYSITLNIAMQAMSATWVVIT
jgi:hypothetical protein